MLPWGRLLECCLSDYHSDLPCHEVPIEVLTLSVVLRKPLQRSSQQKQVLHLPAVQRPEHRELDTCLGRQLLAFHEVLDDGLGFAWSGEIVRVVQSLDGDLMVEFCVSVLDEVLDLRVVFQVLRFDLIFVRLDEDADVTWVNEGNLAQSGTSPDLGHLCGRETRLPGSS